LLGYSLGITGATLPPFNAGKAGPNPGEMQKGQKYREGVRMIRLRQIDTKGKAFALATAGGWTVMSYGKPVATISEAGDVVKLAEATPTTMRHINRWKGGEPIRLGEWRKMPAVKSCEGLELINLRDVAPIGQLQGSAYAQVVKIGDGMYDLFSYGTHVATVSGGQFFKLWDGYTFTTLVHINKFREWLGFKKLTGRQWLEL